MAKTLDKKQCNICHDWFDPRGLPQHKRFQHGGGVRVKTNRNGVVDKARLQRNSLARAKYRARRKHHQPVTQQESSNTQAVRIAMLYIIKQDTEV